MTHEEMFEQAALDAAATAARCYDGITDDSELAYYRTLLKTYVHAAFANPQRYHPFNYLDDAFGAGGDI